MVFGGSWLESCLGLPRKGIFEFDNLVFRWLAVLWKISRLSESDNEINPLPHEHNKGKLTTVFLLAICI